MSQFSLDNCIHTIELAAIIRVGNRSYDTTIRQNDTFTYGYLAALTGQKSDKQVPGKKTVS